MPAKAQTLPPRQQTPLRPQYPPHDADLNDIQRELLDIERTLLDIQLGFAQP